MFKAISTNTLILPTTLVVLALSSNSLAQSKLSAKASSFQPQPVSDSSENDRTRDGLVGPVRRVRTEVVKLTSADGRIVEGKRSLLEVVAYDVKGNKIENQYYPVSGATLTGKEVYKYDDKGNINEMTLLNDDGSLLSRETYKYEFDFAGNWNKMTTSVAVVDAGRFTFEPTEITYRSIMYYLDANMVKMAQPGAQPKAAAPTTANSTESLTRNAEPKAQPASSTLTNKQPSSSQNSGEALPPPSVASSDLSVTNSVEMKNAGDAPISAQTIILDSEPPPNPAPRPILKPVSGGVLNGKAVSLPTPVYPEAARRTRTSGTVVVEVVIDETGKVVSAEASGGPVVLREAAVQAARRARFSPTKLSGQPVKVSGLINYKFALSQ
ncbi:MAG: energy transducer TonB [Pyrinomonadaceae bacterium]